MKKILSLFIISVALASCSEEVEINHPASMQSHKDGAYWKAQDINATVAVNNALTIVVTNRFETLTLKTTSTYPGTYSLGAGDSRKATYFYSLDGVDLNYTTALATGNGEIEITEYDTINKTVTGKFKFNAVNDDANSTAPKIVNFNYGGFYKIPVTPSY